MSIPFASEAWLKALIDQLNQSPTYRETAKHWEADMCYLIEPDGILKEPICLYLDLWHGECRSGRILAPGETPQATLTLRAPFSRIVEILQGKLDAVTALLTGRLTVKGNLAILMRDIPTVLEFVRQCRALDTDFANVGNPV
jgi:putative sterol carrier protein